MVNNIGFLSVPYFFGEKGAICDNHLLEGCLHCRDSKKIHPKFGIEKMWTLNLIFPSQRNHIRQFHRGIGFTNLGANLILCCLVLNISEGLVCLVTSFYILILGNSLTMISFAFLVLLKTLLKYSLKEFKEHQKETWFFFHLSIQLSLLLSLEKSSWIYLGC